MSSLEIMEPHDQKQQDSTMNKTTGTGIEALTCFRRHWKHMARLGSCMANLERCA